MHWSLSRLLNIFQLFNALAVFLNFENHLINEHLRYNLDDPEFDAQISAQISHRAMLWYFTDSSDALQNLHLQRDSIYRRYCLSKRKNHAAENWPQPIRERFSRCWQWKTRKKVFLHRLLKMLKNLGIFLYIILLNRKQARNIVM